MEATQLDRHRYLSLATFRRDGREVRTRIAPCDARGQVHGAWQEGTAHLVSEDASISRARAALRAKYGWQMWLLDLFSRLAGRIHRRAWIEIEP